MIHARAAASVMAATLMLTACAGEAIPDPDDSITHDAVDPGVVDKAAATLSETLPVRTIGEYPAQAAVADGVQPPTNRWYSALAYAELPARAFPTPVSIAVDAGSIGIAMPTIASTDALIAAQTGEILTARIEGAQSRPDVAVNDPVWTALEYTTSDGEPLATATLAQGWPAVGIVADADVTLELSATPEWGEDGVGQVRLGDATYVALAPDATVEGARVSLPAGTWMQLAPVPMGEDAAAYAAKLTSPVVEVVTSYEVTDEATTALTYETADGGETVLVPPAQVTAFEECGAGTFETIDGPTVACAGNTLTWSVDAVEPTLSLDLAEITDEERGAIADAVAAEAGTGELPADTYFGAKALYREAQLLALAHGVGDDDAAELLTERLAEQLRVWTEPRACEVRGERCFVFDDTWGGVVGLVNAFGSEQFNDHHFHYGYLIYAAALAVQEGAVAAEDVAPVIDALVVDVASDGSGEVPVTRSFDPYAGHAWASGTSPFADGNNQESSAEAVMAWTGVAAWAALRGDSALEERARWMLSAEAQSAVSLYVRPDTSFAPAYAHEVVGIQWGAKRDYATWFSPDPAAMLGIQLIPLTPPTLATLAPQDAESSARVEAAVAEGLSGDRTQFVDLITAYSALAGDDQRQAAWGALEALEAEAIDDGLTRAYLLAAIATSG